MAGTQGTSGTVARITSGYAAGTHPDTPSYVAPPDNAYVEIDAATSDQHKSGKKYDKVERLLYKGEGSGLGASDLSPDPNSDKRI